MSECGYVYILINPSLEGLIKIGKTTRNTQLRAKELSAASGVPTPFVVGYELYVNDCDKAEKFIHEYLGELGYRINDDREFFNAPMTEAINAFMIYKDKYNSVNNNSNIENVEINLNDHWKGLEETASSYWNGDGDNLQDYKKAIELYKKAFKLGSPIAGLWIGLGYRFGLGCNKDLDKALEYYGECVRRNTYTAYASMMLIYFQSGNVSNALKCWNLYVKNIDDIDPYICFEYIVESYKFNIPLENILCLKNIKYDIIKRFNEAIEDSSDDYQIQSTYENSLRYIQYIFTNEDMRDSEFISPQDYIIDINKKLNDEYEKEQRNAAIERYIISGVIVLILYILLRNI